MEKGKEYSFWVIKGYMKKIFSYGSQEVSQLINEEEMIKLECHHSLTPNELLDLGTDKKWLLTTCGTES